MNRVSFKTLTDNKSSRDYICMYEPDVGLISFRRYKRRFDIGPTSTRVVRLQMCNQVERLVHLELYELYVVSGLSCAFPGFP